MGTAQQEKNQFIGTADLRRSARTTTWLHGGFGVFLLVSLLVFWKILNALVVYSLHNESSSHVLLVPIVTAYLLFTERKRTFAAARPSVYFGAVLILVGAALFWIAARNALLWHGDDALSLSTMALVVIWIGGFLSFYGRAASRAALFSLLFLLLMVPLPEKALDWVIYLLQQGSTDVTCFLFNLLGVPFLREGFVLTLSSVKIEVAQECSGIRSSIALFITCLLASHLFLRTWWKIAFFVLLVFPLVVIKNGIRIATLTLLSIYVDPGFLHGRLHNQGGFVFFLLGLLLLFPVFVALEKSEHPRRRSNAQSPSVRVAAQ